MIDTLRQLFSRKNKEQYEIMHYHVRDSFLRVSDDITQLRDNISHLHVGQQLSQRDLKNLQTWIGHLYTHSQELKRVHEDIFTWIKHLHHKSNDVEGKIKEISQKQEVSEKGVGNTLATLNSKVEELTATIKKLKEEKKAVASVGNVGNVGNVAVATPTTDVATHSKKIKEIYHEEQDRKKVRKLPTPLQKLLAFLITAGEPMTYEQIAARTGKSKTTIRVDMNRLKNYDCIEEYSTPSGTKLFAAKNSEKIKKLYNIETL